MLREQDGPGGPDLPPLLARTAPAPSPAAPALFCLQDPPHLGNQWTDDTTLRQILRRLLPPDVLAAAAPDLEAFGAAVAGHIKALGRQAEEELPRLQQYDAWGRRRLAW